jgi:hypothetical protein
MGLRITKRPYIFLWDQFRIADANFATSTMGAWLQEVGRMQNRAKADLAEKRPFG